VRHVTELIRTNFRFTGPARNCIWPRRYTSIQLLRRFPSHLASLYYSISALLYLRGNLLFLQAALLSWNIIIKLCQLNRCADYKVYVFKLSVYDCLNGALFLYLSKYHTVGGPGNSVGIATDYGLDGPGSNPGGGRDFPPVQTGPGAHPASCKMGTGSFQGVKCGRGVLLTTHPLLVPRSWKSKAIPLPTL